MPLSRLLALLCRRLTDDLPSTEHTWRVEQRRVAAGRPLTESQGFLG